MITRQDLAIHLHDYLDCGLYSDYAPNGIQVEGCDNITRICTAVSASQSIIEKAIAKKADALLVHHGYFWRGEDAVITGMKRQRIGELMKHNINLFAYHLPLDCHSIIGNNVCLGQLLGLQAIAGHTVNKTPNLIWSGGFSAPMTAMDLRHLINNKLHRDPLVVGDLNKPIRKVAWCTGAAQDFIEDAYALGVDAYISGEISERTYYQAQELGILFIAAGHHASERLGIQALGAYLNDKFSLEHQYIDSDNPV